MNLSDFGPFPVNTPRLTIFTWRRGYVALEWKLADLWVGAFWDRRWRSEIGCFSYHVWICLIPCVPIHLWWWTPEPAGGVSAP